VTLSPRIWKVILIPFAALALIAPKRPDFPRSSFRLELEGSSLGSFTSLEGPGLAIEIVEFRDGSDPIPRKLPGRTTWSNLTLKRGFVSRSFFETWIHQVREGTPDFRKNLSLLILDGRGAEIARYDLFRCWPASWKLSSPELEGKGTDVVIEEVVIAVERLERS